MEDWRLRFRSGHVRGVGLVETAFMLLCTLFHRHEDEYQWRGSCAISVVQHRITDI
jgi:hypothetical protein